MNIAPVKIKREGNEGLTIEWSDGRKDTLSSEVLRVNCPCAGCKEQRGDTTHAQPLTGTPSPIIKGKKGSLKIITSAREDELSLEKVWGVGNYAIGLQWKDSHSTGIYTYNYLRELGDSAAPSSAL